MTAILSLAGVLAALAGVWRNRQRLDGTTLKIAWGLLIAVLALIAACRFADLLPSLRSDWREAAWYVATVLLLAPPVAVLGARRPGAHAWTWFVLVPLVVVLSWPMVNAWTEDGPPQRLLLEGPHLLGFAVVLTMGAGNYFGTRHTLAALLYAAAAVLFVAPYVEWSPLAPFHARLAATLLFATSVALPIRRRLHAVIAAPYADWNVVWLEFRDTFGIVWAKRVMDRLNEAARHERWPSRLELDGFVAAAVENPMPPERVELQIDYWMRVLLRRFVEPSWIDARRRNDSEPQPPEAS